MDRARWPDLVTETLPVLVCYVDCAGLYQHTNRAYEEWFGLPAEAIRGHHVAEVLGSDAYERLRPYVARALAGERVAFTDEIPYRTGTRIVDAVYVPDVVADGSVRGFAALVQDATDRARAERRLRLLAEASAVLAGSLDYEETLRRVVRLALPDLADFAGLSLLDESDRLQPVALAHVDPAKEAMLRELAERRRLDLDDPTSLASLVARTGRSIVTEVSSQAVAAIVPDDELRRLALALEARWALVVPVVGRERALGALGLVSTAPDRPYDDDDQRLAEELGRRAGLAVENARLHREVQRAREHQQFLLEASLLLASTLDYRAELEQIVRLAVPTLADWCAIDLIEADGQIRRLVAVHRDPARAETIAELQRRYPVLDPAAPHTITRVLATGRSWFDPAVDEDRFVAEARDPEHLALLRSLGFAAEIVVPLTARGRALGTLTLVLTSRERRYDRADLALAEELASWCGLAIDNAHLYEAERAAVAEARRSEARYRALFEGLLDAAVVSDAAGRYLDVNPAMSQLLGYTREEFLSFCLGELSIETAHAHEEFEQLRRTGAWRGEWSLRHKDGSIVAVESSVRRVELPEGVVYLGVMRDVTARKAAEADAGFLAALSERILAAEDADALLGEVVREVGTYLQAERCFFIEIDHANDRGIIRRDFCRGVPSVAGDYPMSAYSSETRVRLAAGQPIVIEDAQGDPRTAPWFEQTYEPAGEHAFVGVPLRRDGVWQATLSVTVGRPRRWQRREITLLETVAERTWQAIERLRLTAELRQTEERLNLAQAAGGVGVWDWTVASGEMFWSETMWLLYGRSPCGRQPDATFWATCLHPDDRARVIARVERFLAAEGTEYRDEFRVVRPDGITRWVESVARLERSAAGAPLRMFGINRDVTDRKRLEDRLAFLAAFGSGLAASLDYDRVPEVVARLIVPAFADYCFVDLLQADGTVRRVGWAHADPTWQRRFDDEIQALFPPHPPSQHPIVQAIATGGPVFAPTIDGPWLERIGLSPAHRVIIDALGPRSLVAVPMTARDHVIGALSVWCTDDSGRRFSTEDLAAARSLGARSALAIDNARLYREAQEEIARRRQAEEERRAFVDAVAHDVKGPLGVVKGQAQLMQRRLRRGDSANPAGLETGLGRIEEAADRTVGLIEEMLDAAHLQAGTPLELRLVPTDLVELARRCAGQQAQSTTRHEIRVETALSELVGTWDLSRLERVVANLLQNAIKYSPAGGDVTIELERLEDERGAWAELRVRDRGIGIPTGDLPHVFERFRRGSNVSGRFAGTGIGLAGARQIVEQHGGSIAVASVEGCGSVFTVRLPL
jgi:PAS domain S-box-containing protein